MVYKYLKKKAVIWSICALPLCLIVIITFFHSPLLAKFWSWSRAINGYTAAVLLAICLSSAPLHKNYPSIQLLTILNRHKRETGLSAFFYATLHASSYVIKKWLTKGTFDWSNLLKPVIIPGLIVLSILLILALTSNNFSRERLTYQRWKGLHRSVYVAEGLIFLHMLFQGGKVLVWGCLIFIPLFICQFLRLKKPSR